MKRTLIIYESKYGTTKEAVYQISKVLGPAIIIKPKEFSNNAYNDIESVFIATPVFSERLPKEMDELLLREKEWLRARKVALLAVCTGPNSASRYFETYLDLLGDCVVWVGGLGGMIDPDILDEEDYDSIRRFSISVRIPFRKRDNRDITDLAKKALEIRKKLSVSKELDIDKTTKAIDNFLLKRNTCTLCTGYELEVRATPMEYIYFNRRLYFLSEGGEKFANLFINENASVAVYDTFTGFQTLAGMQMSGTAKMVDAASETYEMLIKYKGITPEKLPIQLHLIEFSPIKYEMLDMNFNGGEKVIFEAILEGESYD